LEEPKKNSYAVSMSNVVLRGCTYVGTKELICLSMETGIDSLLLKSIQHPYTQRHQHEFSSYPRKKQISDKLSEDIQRYENTFLGLNIEGKMEYLVYVMFVAYFAMLVMGILVHFCYGSTTKNEFYLPQTIVMWKIILYHATNFIIFLSLTFFPSGVFPSGGSTWPLAARSPRATSPRGSWLSAGRRTGTREPVL